MRPAANRGSLFSGSMSEMAILQHLTDATSGLHYYVLAMTELVVEILVALLVFLLWLTVVSVLVRPFGIQLPFTPFNWADRRSVFQSLTFSQFLMVGGILYFGCGVFVV